MTTTKASIRTRYHGPTDHLDSRLTATGDSARGRLSVTVGYDDSLNGDENHAAAAQAFLDKFLEKTLTTKPPGLYCLVVDQSLVFDGDQYHTWVEANWRGQALADGAAEKYDGDCYRESNAVEGDPEAGDWG